MKIRTYGKFSVAIASLLLLLEDVKARLLDLSVGPTAVLHEAKWQRALHFFSRGEHSHRALLFLTDYKTYKNHIVE